MGLIQAFIGSIAGTLQDTWKDYFVCDALDNNTLMVKGVKKGSKGLFADGDIISDGSGIVVSEGQCAIIVDEGQIVEVAAEPGGYTFDTSTSPSIFSGGFQGIKDTFAEMVEHFTYGGRAAKNQRVYYINTKEITGNMFGTATPIPFRVIDKNTNMDLEVPIRCNGEYSFRITNPLLFYKNVAANQPNGFYKETLASQMKAEFLTGLQQALAEISVAGVRYSEVPAHTLELTDALNEALTKRWVEARGISVASVGINSLSLNKEDEDRIKNLQMANAIKDPNMIAATLANAQADALRDAANNPNGSVNGMMAINMMNGNSAISDALNAANQRQQATAAPTEETWTCPTCGATCTGNFCSKCGAQKPASSFCPYCGKPVPAGSAFCPNCGKQL